MDQPKSIRTSGRRQARRSLAEFALPPGGAWSEPAPLAQTSPPVPEATAAPDDGRAGEVSGKRAARPRSRDQRGAGAAPDLPQRGGRDVAAGKGAATPIRIQDLNGATVKAAMDCQSWILKQVTSNMTAAVICATNLAATKQWTAAERPGSAERSADVATAGAVPDDPEAAKTADEYRRKAGELMTANLKIAVEFAELVAKAKAPSEFVRLSASHARRHLELVARQTTELGSIAQKLVKPKSGD